VTEIVTVEATLARVRAKLRAASDEESRYYYQKCIEGWERYLQKLKSECHDDLISINVSHSISPAAESANDAERNCNQDGTGITSDHIARAAKLMS